MNNIQLLYIDLFCGAGGTTTGVELAKLHGQKCAKVIACVNHDANAIASHLANHPEAKHFTEDIRTLEMSPLVGYVDAERRRYPQAKVVLWASLECTNFSRAKGGKPRDADSRTLAEHLYRYIEALKPDYIEIENVEEFMCWGAVDDNGKPIHRLNGIDYLRWCETVKAYGYSYSWRVLNAADFGAYTSRKRFFGLFAKDGLPCSFPERTHCKGGANEGGLFAYALERWKPVRDVLDLQDEGESIFGRKKPLCDRTLERIYAGLLKFVANGDRSFMVKYNSTNQRTGRYCPPSIDAPAPTVACQNRLAVAFISKQFSGHPASKNHSIDEPSGAVTAKDHHAFVTAYYGNGFNSSTDDVAPTLTTKDRLALVQPKFIVNEYGNSGNGNSLESVCPAICVKPKQQLVSVKRHYLLNPQYQSKGRSVDDSCFTLIARMDKMPPYLVTTESGEVVIRFDDTDTPMMRKVKQFMADYGIIDIKMRMLKVDELKRIMGFPTDYVLVGTQTEQKKFIGNAVEVNMSRVLCEALAGSIECRTN